tara:strand:- start:102 stop:1361 length:1260 start_codon:yes stop_codon:yes gene_type:complete
MQKNKLAYFGGHKLINKKFKEFNSHNMKEVLAAKKVASTGILSGYIANNTNDFYGGKYVKKLESYFKSYFNVKHAISVNSWTSGLVCAVGALNIKPGDEIIVSPWTMSASATAIITWGAIPIFSEIDTDTFCLDPNFIEEKINKNTKAIMVVDIFGQSADYKKINLIAKKYKLKVISDTAQAIGSKQSGKYSGTLSDIGGFSLNRHKHIHCGEGGVIITNNDYLAKNMYKIRNHGEVINKDKNFPNLLGFNFRLNEIEAAIAIEQLKKLKVILKKKVYMAERLTKGLSGLEGLELPKIGKNNTHVYYSYSIKINSKIIKTKKNRLIKYLKAEGLPVSDRYVNILEYDMYLDKKISNHYPWSTKGKNFFYSKKSNVYKQIVNLNDNEFMDLFFCKYDFSKQDIDLIISCFNKVWKKLDLS